MSRNIIKRMVSCNVGAVSLGFLMVATPVGWVGLIVGGRVVAGVAATAPITMNSIVKDRSAGLYDEIMKWT